MNVFEPSHPRHVSKVSAVLAETNGCDPCGCRRFPPFSSVAFEKCQQSFEVEVLTIVVGFGPHDKVLPGGLEEVARGGHERGCERKVVREGSER